MEYQVVIPRYRRAEWLVQRTLTTLLNGKVDPARITVFVHDNDPQQDAYHDVAAATGVHITATPARGIIAQRAYISNSYPASTRIVSLDDDVTGLRSLGTDGKLHPVQDLDAYIGHMFTETEKAGLKAWGLAPVGNPFFMKPELSQGLKFLIYTCVGYINEPGHPAQQNTVPTKDDYEHSIRRWWWDGGVIRGNGTYATADVYKGAGGLMGTGQRTPDKAEAAIRKLERQWPGIIRRNHRRKSDFPEIILNPHARHQGHDWLTPPPGADTAGTDPIVSAANPPQSTLENARRTLQ